MGYLHQAHGFGAAQRVSGSGSSGLWIVPFLILLLMALVLRLAIWFGLGFIRCRALRLLAFGVIRSTNLLT